jgi:Domain of unknown function (DUF222)
MSNAPLGTTALAGLVGALAGLDQRVEDSVRIDRIRLLEELKAAAAAAQARETAAFAVSQRAAQRAAGVAAKEVGRGIPGQVGLARRVSPYLAARYVGWASILTTELPHTFAALAAGRVSEWRAMLLARETAWLTREHRTVVDAEMAPQLERLGDRGIEREARRIGSRLDPQGYLDRFAAAAGDRRVSIRPAPDAMVRLTALLPVAQGVACHAALAREADSVTAEGDERGRGQLMADTLVERVTGQARAADVPITVNLVMTDTALLEPAAAGGNEPALLDGYGPLAAPLARCLVTEPSCQTPMWIRRLYTTPGTGQLIAMDSRQRFFTAGQRLFIRLRDQQCRTAWCEAPIRHTDHITPHQHGGVTSTVNGQGDCEACNYAKQAPGWVTRVVDRADGRHEVETITPTGHHYRSRAPDPPGGTAHGFPTKRPASAARRRTPPTVVPARC